MEQSKRCLVHVVASNRWGGAERYALDICRHFLSKGWRVEAYTRDAKAVDGLFAEAGVALRHAPLQGLADIRTLRQLVSDMVSMPEGTMIHTHRYRDAMLCLVARRLSRRPDIGVVNTRHIVRRGRDSWLYRRMYRNLDAQIFVSEAARERFVSTWRRRRLPFPQDRVHVIHNSIFVDLEPPVPEPQKGPVIAMFHGPLSPGKGLEVLIDALPRLKGLRTRLRIVGTGHPDYVDALRQRAQARGVMEMIDWHRHVADPHPLIRASHFGVLPSVVSEAFGLTNIEYMANGRPQICTGNGAQTEYLTNGTDSLIVPPGSATALGDAMVRLATDSGLRRGMGEAAFSNFSRTLAWPAFAARMEEIYDLHRSSHSIRLKK